MTLRHLIEVSLGSRDNWEIQRTLLSLPRTPPCISCLASLDMYLVHAEAQVDLTPILIDRSPLLRARSA